MFYDKQEHQTSAQMEPIRGEMDQSVPVGDAAHCSGGGEWRNDGGDSAKDGGSDCAF